ncbi:MAG: hypothetical protein AAFO29_01835 [Actinomycetota bacterium]
MSSLPAGLLAVRKAAVLAHWVPGISLLVSQPDWPGVMVSTTPWDMGDGWWMPVDPCTFRREVGCLPGRPSGIVGPRLGAEDTDLRIEVVTSGSTRFDDAGLFSLPFDEHHSAVGFSVLASIGLRRAAVSGQPETPTCLWDVDGPPQLLQNVDADLGVKLISCCYPSTDELRASLAREAMLEAMLSAGADEVATVAGVL